MVQPSMVEHIEITPGVCGGKPRIAGHRIRVQDVVAWHEVHGMSPDEIASGFPQITLADVYAALAYYHDHREGILRDMRDEVSLVESLRSKTPSKLVAKLMQGDAVLGQVPPRRARRIGDRGRAAASRF